MHGAARIAHAKDNANGKRLERTDFLFFVSQSVARAPTASGGHPS